MQRRNASIGKCGHVLHIELGGRMQCRKVLIGRCALILGSTRPFRTLLRMDDPRSRDHKRRCEDECIFPHDGYSFKPNISANYSFARNVATLRHRPWRVGSAWLLQEAKS